MDPRVVGALGERQQLGDQHEAVALDALVGTDALLVAGLVEAEDPQLALLDAIQTLAPLLLVDGVFVVAEEGEVVVEQPLDEGRGLLVVLGLDLLGPRGLELGQGRPGLVAHRLEVGHRGAHVAKHLLQADLDLLENGRGGVAIDLDGDQRLALLRGIGLPGRGDPLEAMLAIALGGEDGVVNGVHGHAAAVELDAHRIDQEGHVLVQHGDEGMGGLPAVLLEVGVEDPHLGIGGIELLQEVPHRERGAVDVVETAIGQVIERDRGIEVAGEGLDLSGLVLVQTALQPLLELLEQILSGLLMCDMLHPSPRLPAAAGSGRENLTWRPPGRIAVQLTSLPEPPPTTCLFTHGACRLRIAA